MRWGIPSVTNTITTLDYLWFSFVSSREITICQPRTTLKSICSGRPLTPSTITIHRSSSRASCRLQLHAHRTSHGETWGLKLAVVSCSLALTSGQCPIVRHVACNHMPIERGMGQIISSRVLPPCPHKRTKSHVALCSQVVGEQLRFPYLPSRRIPMGVHGYPWVSMGTHGKLRGEAHCRHPW